MRSVASLLATSRTAGDKTVFLEASRWVGIHAEQQHTWSVGSPCSWQSGADMGIAAEHAALAGQIAVKPILAAARKTTAISNTECLTDIKVA